ncbi:MaoC family dehydratase [Bradyrhizobium sp. S69]|uniref:MaoC family dehydratase n=1 Tax=Bradyrhizobium sp. S69 TaxID=1641856 RepID=UPI00131E6073|nr:MaoC family dehydratase [Bradyrhizobium sp. S69]
MAIGLDGNAISVADFSAQLGKQVGSSAWRPIAQARIDRFAEATDDFQFVHVDRERAARETPFGGTIAQRLLTLSMVGTLAEDILPVSPELIAAVLIGVDRIKFLSPVKTGSRIRGIFRLDRAARLSQSKLVIRLQCTIENEAKPALSCEMSWMLVLDEPSAETGSSASALQPVQEPIRG